MTDLTSRVRELLDLGASAEWDQAIEFFAPDAEWIAVDGIEVARGTDIRDFWIAWYAPYDDVRIETVEVVGVGRDVVLAVLRQSGRLGGSAMRLGEEIALVYEWRAGAIQRVTTHADVEEGRMRARGLVDGDA